MQLTLNTIAAKADAMFFFFALATCSIPSTKPILKPFIIRLSLAVFFLLDEAELGNSKYNFLIVNVSSKVIDCFQV